MLANRHILLIITGGIAAFKSLELIRRLREGGAFVTPVMTAAATEFVTPLSVSALAGQKVYQDLFNLTDEAEMGHIELSRSADMVVVAPCSANLMAKMATGLANDLASTLLLATDTPVLIAPAMNVRMWDHPATQRNTETLSADGINFVGPKQGDMACGEYGSGRMAEPNEIVRAIDKLFMDMDGAKPLSGKRVVVTSGPTHEPIDPVRYIANRSSGAQGSAIANALLSAGAEVEFVTGPADVAPPVGAQITRVQTAKEMLEAVEAALPCDVAIFVAAVADWCVVSQNDSKLKKETGKVPVLEFAENPDILSIVAHRDIDRPTLVIGFAAETDNIENNARLKLGKKGCDWIVANDVSIETGVMGGNENAVHLISAKGADKWDMMSKTEVAERLVLKISDALGEE